MKNARISLIVDCPQIHVLPGEFVMVWLGSFDEPGGRTQVELAVLPDGSRRICTPCGAPVAVMSFEAAYGPRGAAATKEGDHE